VGFPFVDGWVAPNSKIRDFWPIFSKEQHHTKSTVANSAVDYNQV